MKLRDIADVDSDSEVTGFAIDHRKVARGSVFGAFKGTVVKEQVYEPDWRSEERTRYTINVADVLADVAPDDIAPSIQTAPLGFKQRRTHFHVPVFLEDLGAFRTTRFRSRTR